MANTQEREARVKVVRVMLTATEQRDMAQAALDAGLPLAIYVRITALAAARTKPRA